MTVIAWDGEYLVTDSRSTVGSSLISDKVVKLANINHPDLGDMVFGYSGCLPLLGNWIDHLEKNGFSKIELDIPAEEGEIFLSGLFVRESTGQCFYSDTYGLYYEVTTPCAIGSGSDIANHFLATGHGALHAVLQTVKTELSCGGPLRCYSWKDKSVTVSPS